MGRTYSLVLLPATNEHDLLFHGEAFRGEDAVRQEEQHEDPPEDGRPAADEEYGAPDGKAVHLADAVGDQSTDLHSQ